MSEQMFKQGTVVRLKSGGPKMTVVNFGKYGMGATDESYLCKWFDEKNKVVQETFYEAEFEEVTKKSPEAVAPARTAVWG
jgi:uncharacterized protein YodC (DUF2158 family)